MPRTLGSTYGYIYERATGALVSDGTVITDPLPAHLALYEHPARMDGVSERWDPQQRRVTPFTNQDRIAALNAQRAAEAAEIIRLGGTPL